MPQSKQAMGKTTHTAPFYALRCQRAPDFYGNECGAGACSPSMPQQDVPAGFPLVRVNSQVASRRLVKALQDLLTTDLVATLRLLCCIPCSKSPPSCHFLQPELFLPFSFMSYPRPIKPSTNAVFSRKPFWTTLPSERVLPRSPEAPASWPDSWPLWTALIFPATESAAPQG